MIMFIKTLKILCILIVSSFLMAAKTPEDVNRCDAEFDPKIASIENRMSAIPRLTRNAEAGTEFSKNFKLFNKKKEQYSASRTSGNMEVARALALEMDQNWSKLVEIEPVLWDEAVQSHGKSLKQHELYREVCQITAAAANKNCVVNLYRYFCKKDRASNTYVFTKKTPILESRAETFLGHDYSKSWRTPEDYVFETCEATHKPDTSLLLDARMGIEVNLAAARGKQNELHLQARERYKAYLALRKAQDDTGALTMAEGVDRIWTEATTQHEKVLSLLQRGKEVETEICRLTAEVYPDTCTQFSVETCLKQSEPYQKLLSMSDDKDITTTRYEKSWRKPRDQDKEIINACFLDNPTYKGFVKTISGRAFIERGIKTLPAKVGSRVKVGDKVNVEEGSRVSIELFGSGLITITEKTSFQIPETESAPSFKEESVVKKTMSEAWHKVKHLLKGDSFEIKTPTAVCGVRG